MQETKHKNAVIYCRVSTKEQVEEGNSLVTQEKMCREYALAHGYSVVQIFIEQGESAKTADRTELKKLLDYCSYKKHQITAVIAYKIDRISRNTDDYSQIRLLLKRYNVEIKSTSEHFENSPAGRFMENIIANVAQFDNDVRAERSINGMKEAVREGRYVWYAPVGYTNIRVQGKSTIIPDASAPLIRDAFTLMATNNYTVEEVWKMMLKKGLTNRTGKPLSRPYFHRVLRNQLYTGWVQQFGEKHKGLFEPIITEDLFTQVQRVLHYGGRKQHHYQVEHPDFPLRRFVFHPSGSKLTGAWSQGRKSKYPYYLFRNPCVSFPRDTLEDSFKAFLNRYALDDRYFEQLQTLLHEQVDKKLQNQRQEKAELQKKITVLQTRQSALVQKNIAGVISDGVLQHELEGIEQEVTTITAQLYQIPDAATQYRSAAADLREYFKNPAEVWANAPFIYKLKLQWFNFPSGVVLENTKCRTGKIVNEFKAEKVFLGNLSYVVNHLNEYTNTPKVGNKEKAEKLLQTLKLDITRLSAIKKEIDAIRQNDPEISH
jgi:site-specific DNA recombinase